MRSRAILTAAAAWLALTACGGSSMGPSSDGGTDAHGSLDASMETDAAPFCSTPLSSDLGISTLSDVPLAQWCVATVGRLVEWTCQGMTALVVGIGVDCDRQYLFDAASGRLRAVAGGCNFGLACVMGDPDFVPSLACEGGNLSFPETYPCVEAGLPDVAPDGAGVPCEDSAVCPTGYVCGFSTNSSCSVLGFCVYGDFSHDPTCAPTTYCACDGTLTQACAGSYALKPVPTRGQATTCGD